MYGDTKSTYKQVAATRVPHQRVRAVALMSPGCYRNPTHRVIRALDWYIVRRQPPIILAGAPAFDSLAAARSWLDEHEREGTLDGQRDEFTIKWGRRLLELQVEQRML